MSKRSYHSRERPTVGYAVQRWTLRAARTTLELACGLSLEERPRRDAHRQRVQSPQLARVRPELRGRQPAPTRDDDPVRLVQLISCSGAPFDFVAAGDPRTYADLVTPNGLREIARYADGIGACKDVLIPRTASGALGQPTNVIRDARRRSLRVHGWTFRRENQFLPLDFRIGSDPNAVGDLVGEIDAFIGAGMDGFFTDNPDLGVVAARR